MRPLRYFLSIWVLLFLLTLPMMLNLSPVGAEEKNYTTVWNQAPLVLITGFEPFGGYDTNPSQLIAETLNGQEVAGAQIVGITVPVEFNESVATVTQAIDDLHPIIVVSIGLEARAHTIHIENVGVNLQRDPYDTENGSKIRQIDPCGPGIRFSTLPERAITRALRRSSIPARQSWWAGTYVCNTLL